MFGAGRVPLCVVLASPSVHQNNVESRLHLSPKLHILSLETGRGQLVLARNYFLDQVEEPLPGHVEPSRNCPVQHSWVSTSRTSSILALSFHVSSTPHTHPEETLLSLGPRLDHLLGNSEDDWEIGQGQGPVLLEEARILSP